MHRFAETCEAIAATTKKNEKVRLVADFLRALRPEDAELAALFLTGRAFPRREEKVLAVGASLFWQAIGRLSGTDAETMEQVYAKHGDLGDMAAQLLAGKPAGGLSLREVAHAFADLAERRGPASKLAALEELLSRASALEAKYIIKIVAGDLRIGLKESLVEEAIARAFEQPGEAVQRANMLTGDIGETLRLTAAGGLAEARLCLFQPVGFMLATAAETSAEIIESFPEGALVEDKYDGIRAQAHKTAGRVELFSRTLDRITEFPELIPALRALPGEFILDGEIVAWREGRALPFTELQTRLGRKQTDQLLQDTVPVNFLAFDVLYRDGELLLDAPLRERRRHLKTLLGENPPADVQLVQPERCTSASQLQQAFEAALERGNEGVMAKAPDSPYRPGRRGRFWLKLKRPLATLDVVVTAVEFGHGKRRGLLSDYTFAVRHAERLVNIGKAYSGLTDAEIRELTAYFLEHTMQDQGFRRLVEPSLVIEVAFNNIQRSRRHESGFALRFPRIVRLRRDKPVSEIDTLEQVKKLYERQFVAARAARER